MPNVPCFMILQRGGSPLSRLQPLLCSSPQRRVRGPRIQRAKAPQVQLGVSGLFICLYPCTAGNVASFPGRFHVPSACCLPVSLSYSLPSRMPGCGVAISRPEDLLSTLRRCGSAALPWTGFDFLVPKKESIEVITEQDGSQSCWVLILSYKVQCT